MTAMLVCASCTASFLIAAILLLRRLTPGLIAPQAGVVLWDIVLARLLFPAALPAPLHLAVPLAAGSSGSAAVGSTWLWLWAAGATATAVTMIGLYLREWKVLREALPLGAAERDLISRSGVQISRVRVLMSDQVTTPVAAGILRRRIVLPKGCSGWDARTMRFALTHELIHLHRSDNLQKLLMSAVLCLHWFNPLVWYMRSCFDRDLERACDESVIAQLGEHCRCDYADTLLGLAARQTNWSLCGNGFGRSAIHERILSMLRQPRLTMAGWLTTAAIAVSAAAAFACAPAAPASPVQVNQEVVYMVDLDTGEIYAGGQPAGFIDAGSPQVSFTQVTAKTTGGNPGDVQITLNQTGLFMENVSPASNAGNAD